MNAERNTSPSAPALSSCPEILFVEDETLLRLWIADELRASGFIVYEAATADEALDVLRSSVPIQVVLTDVRMPGRMDGAALAEWLRRERPELKIIIASAQSNAIRADASVPKPYSPAQIVGTIAKLFDLEGASSAGSST